MLAKLIVHGEDRAAALRAAVAMRSPRTRSSASRPTSRSSQRVVAHDAFATRPRRHRPHRAAITRAVPAAAADAGRALARRGARRDAGARRRARGAAARGVGRSAFAVARRRFVVARAADRHALAFTFADGEARHEVAVRRRRRAVARHAAVGRDRGDASTARRSPPRHRDGGARVRARPSSRDGEERHVFCRGVRRQARARRSARACGRRGGARRPPDGADVRHGRRGDGQGRRQGRAAARR